MTGWRQRLSSAGRPSRFALVAAATLLGAAGSGGEPGPLRPRVAAQSQPQVAAAAQRTLPLVTAPPVPVTAPPVTASPVPVTPAVTGPISIPPDPYAPEPLAQLGTIEIPKLGLSHALFQGVTLHNIDRGPSHWPGSALPGQPGNAVVAGHRSTRGRPFRHLDDLVAGDTVTFTVGGMRSTYRVTGDRVVGPDDTWIANQTESPTATLYACHPPGSARQRYVVHLVLA